jgi:hypothetical protein
MKYRFCCSSLFFLTTIALFSCVIADSVEAQRNHGGRGGGGWTFVAGKYDANKDGKVTVKEYTRGEEAFKSLDSNGDGLLNESDWANQNRRRGGGGSAAPAVGEVAPDFSLTEIKNSDKTVTLSEFAGKKPVALIFGSCT